MPKINRPLDWIRKVLEVTQKTSAPEAFEDQLRTTLDAFGWDRFNETQHVVNSSVASSFVVGNPVPADTLRLILEASIETNDPAGGFSLWIVHDDTVGRGVAVMPPVLTTAIASVQAGMPRSLVLKSDDRLRGEMRPAAGVGLTLTLRSRFIDLPIGEYINTPS